MTLITVEEFVNYTNEERKQYIQEIIGYKEGRILAKVFLKNKERKWLFVKPIQLSTGEEVELFSDNNKNIYWQYEGDIETAPNKGEYVLVEIKFTNPRPGEVPIKVGKDIIRYKDFNAFLNALGLQEELLNSYGDLILKGSSYEAPTGEKYINAVLYDILEKKIKVELEATKEAERLKNEIELKSIIERENKKIKRLNHQADRLSNVLTSYKEDVAAYEGLLGKAREEYKFLQHLGFELPQLAAKESEGGFEVVEDEVALLKQIDLYLQREEGLYYDFDMIERFYYALKTDQMLILCGPPGTGKTSLATAFTKAIGGQTKVISVQPNWTDNQDLLGFYNPIEKRYMPTVFLDALVEAKEHPEQLYIICLDEMNLAHVEYYFSEILSTMEQKDKCLALYSDYYFKQEVNQLKRKAIAQYQLAGDLTDEAFNQWLSERKNQEDYQDLYDALQTIYRYPANFKLPSNVRFVGTMNNDETTKSISPKVIDRSYIIEVRESSEIKSYEEIEAQVVHLNARHFNSNKIGQNEELAQLIETLRPLLIQMGVNLTKRFERQVAQLLATKNDREMIDYILLGKVLPKFDMELDDEKEGFLLTVKNKIQAYEQTKYKFESMYHEDSQIFTYWR